MCGIKTNLGKAKADGTQQPPVLYTKRVNEVQLGE